MQNVNYGQEKPEQKKMSKNRAVLSYSVFFSFLFNKVYSIFNKYIEYFHYIPQI